MELALVEVVHLFVVDGVFFEGEIEAEAFYVLI